MSEYLKTKCEHCGYHGGAHHQHCSESPGTAGYAEIHANAREATARQTFKAMMNTDRPDIAVAILLRALDEWYEKGVSHGKRA